MDVEAGVGVSPCVGVGNSGVAEGCNSDVAVVVTVGLAVSAGIIELAGWQAVSRRIEKRSKEFFIANIIPKFDGFYFT